MGQASTNERIKRIIDKEATANNPRLIQNEETVRARPAVGIIANGSESGDVAAAIIRAKEAGYQVILAFDPMHVDNETIEFARHLGCEVIEPERDRLADRPPTEKLRRIAREAGYPGVIIQTDLATHVDYEATVNKLKEDSAYLVDAEPEPKISGSPEVLIGIPAYNEASSIRDVILRARQYGSVLVVDDGSEDDTATVARGAGATVVEHDGNRGYGSALKTIFEEANRAKAKHLVIIDGDGQHEPNDIPKLLSTQSDSGADLVIGSRFAEGAQTDAPLYRLIGVFIINVMTNVSLGLIRSCSRVGDTQSGFRVYNRQAIESLATDTAIGDQMGASTDILHHAHRNGFEIQEVGTSVYYDVEERNSQNPITHGLSLINNILVTVERDRPVLTLGVPGALSVLLGSVLGYWTIANFTSSGTFPIGIALLTTFFFLAGILSSLTAVILHSLNTYLLD